MENIQTITIIDAITGEIEVRPMTETEMREYSPVEIVPETPQPE